MGLFDGPNLYAYAKQNTTKNFDPTGEFVPQLIGAGSSIASGFIISKLTGCDYSWKDALVDGATGAAGVGLANKLNKLNRIRKLRNIAKSKGMVNQGKKGYVETCKSSSNYNRLNIKHEAAKSANVQAGSKVPRFDFRVDAGKYWDPFTGATGPKGALSHVPLGPPVGSGTAAGVGAATGGGRAAASAGCDC